MKNSKILVEFQRIISSFFSIKKENHSFIEACIFTETREKTAFTIQNLSAVETIQKNFK